jgi:hypothetical protein
MYRSVLFAACLGSVVPAYAQYTATLTGVGTGISADGVYVSPYVGTIQGQGINYSGYMICDDFYTESHLNQPWSANATNAGSLNGGEKFPSSIFFEGVSYSAQQAYDAAGWLANGLVSPSVLGSPATQINYAFAIWNLFDGATTDPAGGAVSLEQQALTAARNNYQANNVTVYTPVIAGSSQEFLVVSPLPAPEIDPGAAGGALTLLVGGLLVARGRYPRVPSSEC